MTRESIVYVHGLWATPAESLLLRRRLSRAFTVETFRYATVASSMTEVADQLASFVAALAPRTLHLVGHSLGGLVIYRFLERHPGQPPGRVVFIGTPVAGSLLARDVGRWRWGAAVLGRCVAEELLVERERRWTVPRPLGIIAGTRPLGLVPLFARSLHNGHDPHPGAAAGARGGGDERDGWKERHGAADDVIAECTVVDDDANDGTVAVSETRLPGAADHITVSASHLGLLLSARVADEASLFLREGYFALSRRSSSRSSSARSA